MTSIEWEELIDDEERKLDYPRANGAPLVSKPDDPSKRVRYSRPSSYADCLDDKEALGTWKIWKAMTGVAHSKALQTEVIATRDEDRVEKKELREKAMEKGQANERADMGKGLHAMTVRREDRSDVAFDPPEPFRSDLDAYSEMLERYGLVSEMCELAIVNDPFRSAGTADRLWRLTKQLDAPDGTTLDIGTLIIGDLKTGKKLDFSLPGFCVQTALYATGVLYDLLTERRLPTPPICQSWALIAHMPVGTARCDLRWSSIRIGLQGAELASQVKQWRKNWKNGTFDAVAVDVPKSASELLDEMTEEASETISVEAMAQYCQDRINQIGQNSDAKGALIRAWPDGLPTPKKGLQTHEQVITLLNLLDAVERQFSLPFLPDPRVASMKGHRSQTDRSNEFMLTPLDTGI